VAQGAVSEYLATLRSAICPSRRARPDARIQRFGGYATDGIAHAPEPFDARDCWSGSSRSTWSTSLSALGALEEVERSRRDTVVLSDR